MTVTAKLFGPLRESTGATVVDLSIQSGATVGDLLKELRRRFPVLSGKLELWIRTGYVNIFVNGEDVSLLGGWKTELTDGDTILFLPAIGGG